MLCAFTYICGYGWLLSTAKNIKIWKEKLKVSSGQWNSLIFLPSTVWKVKIVQISPNNLLFKRAVWTCGSKCKRHSFWQETGQLTPSLSFQMWAARSIPQAQRPLSDTSWGLSRLPGLTTMASLRPACGKEKETGLKTHGCFQECSHCHVLSDLVIVLWGPVLQESSDEYLFLWKNPGCWFVLSLQRYGFHWCKCASAAWQRGNCDGPNCC